MALIQLKSEFADDNVLILEQDVDAPLGGRVDRWLAGDDSTGAIYLPLAMTDSGHEVSSGDEDFEDVYRDMINRSLARPATASMTVAASVDGSVLHFDVRLTNRSGVTLSAANDATLTALVWEAPTGPGTVPYVAAARTTPIPTLDDGDTTGLILEISVAWIDTARARWVIIADYQSRSATGPYDTLQAVAGP